MPSRSASWRRRLTALLSRRARTRYRLAKAYLSGSGIEIGALHNPLPVSDRAQVRYVDRLSLPDLRAQYPELANVEIVAPTIIDDGEKLSLIADGSLDFIIANHFIEHCEDPITTLICFLSKLKPGGIVYLAVPDKRFTFDRQRESTGRTHLRDDHADGGHNSRAGHYLDFARHSLLNGCGSDTEVEKLAGEIRRTNYSIHFHVWTHEEFLEFLRWLRMQYLPHLGIVEAISNRGEGIFILCKQTAAPGTH
jgi:SAM-dependent methyltransferase